MTDLTEITTPFGLLDPETQAALKAWPHGWEYYPGDCWQPIFSAAWLPSVVYRARPAPLIPDQVDWSQLPEWARYVARDKSGRAWAHEFKPDCRHRNATCWTCGQGKDRLIDDFPLYQRGTVDWRDSLLTRPEGDA